MYIITFLQLVVSVNREPTHPTFLSKIRKSVINITGYQIEALGEVMAARLYQRIIVSFGVCGLLPTRDAALPRI
ncbi:hypothetical protein BABINDRAFT_128097 [Babjeviella inositovora NRRL Y-12698]|uniref:Uncharacterized protein n=1 Tax=Babjeviella inositovora NRRL Y-12698 TaxID=984486 RepID=A0A1E3QV76_9ASCO|nr:uncharacterized protein BABINDRAFT_128097 [Babjeviella inositovora NRRL Y-12698]ODQ80857.1 hypothetical protein BABINDRAFT_128097 [Babjeviella inositovora NRRL Y-12698]